MDLAAELRQLACQQLPGCTEGELHGLMQRLHLMVVKLDTIRHVNQELSSAVAAASKQLLKLGKSLRQHWEAAERAPLRRAVLVLRLAAACALAQGVATLLPLLAPGSGTKEGVLRCTALLLEASRPMLASNGTGETEGRALRWKVVELLRIVLSSPGLPAEERAACVPPSLAIALLAAASRPSPAAEESVDHVTGLAIICTHLGRTSASAFGQHAALLQHDAVVQEQLAAVFARYLSRAAAVLPLPPERRPAAHERVTWLSVRNVAAALPVQCIQPGWDQLMEPGDRPADGFSSGARRLLAASCQLLAAVPLDEHPGMPTQLHAALLFDLLLLAGHTASSMHRQVQEHFASWPWDSTPHRLQPARLLASAAARQPAVLQAALGMVRPQGIAAAVVAEQAEESCRMCAAVAPLLAVLVTGPRSGIRGLELLSGIDELPAWCAAAGGALRVAPLVAQALPELGQHGTAAAEVATSALTLALMASKIANTCCSFAQRGATARWGRGLTDEQRGKAPGPGNGLAAAETALWQLHSAACCAVHSVAAAAGGAQVLRTPPAAAAAGAQGKSPLLQVLWACIMSASNAARWLEAWAEGRVVGGAKMHLRAMASAHVTAVQALLQEMGGTAQRESYKYEWDALPASLAMCAEFGAPALASHADMARLLAVAVTQLIANLPDPTARPGAWDALGCVQAAPRLAAALLDCSLVDTVLQDAIQHDATFQPGWRVNLCCRARDVFSSLLRAKEWAELADAGSAGGGAGSGHLQDMWLLKAAALDMRPTDDLACIAVLQQQALPLARRLAAALLQHWQRPEQQQEDTLALAQAAAGRSCAHLRCPNVALEGGPAAGQGAGSARCSACRAVWYCSVECSKADWRGPGSGLHHKRCCLALKAARDAERAAAAAQ